MQEHSTEKSQRLLHILSCRGVGLKTLEKLIAYDPTLQSIFEMTLNELIHELRLTEKQASAFYEDLRKPLEDLLQLETHSYQYITWFDSEYPPLLRQIFDPPAVLFYEGDLSLFQKPKSLAVVGSRYPTQKALPTMKKILLPLIREGWCIVSGLAYGIDAIGHRLALEEGGATIAVLGSGLRSIYPKEHSQLANEIANRGLLISEFLPKQPPTKWQFPLRNRIISGLTRGTLVVEAQERSGSLITADQALEQGREVFAIPGSVLNNNSKGTNYLIQQGAKLVMSCEDIENELPFDKR